MTTYTCQDAIRILKQKTFLIKLREFKDMVTVIPIPGSEFQGLYFIVIKDSDLFEDQVIKIRCKDETFTYMTMDEYDTQLEKFPENYLTYEVELRKSAPKKRSYAFDLETVPDADV